LQLDSEQLDNNSVLVKLTGRLDIQGAQEIDLPLTVIASSGAEKVLLDVSGVSFLASLGLRSLLSAAKTMSRRGGKMALVSPKANVMEILTVSGVSSLIPIYDDLESGLKSL